MRAFDITTASHTGGREEQQDSLGHWSTGETCLVIVADGVGGSRGGRAASQEVIRCAAEYWESCQGTLTNPEQQLTEIASIANTAIHNLSIGEKRSPASTIVALYLDQTNAHWVHSGDSRLYWLRPQEGSPPQELERTRDHSVVQMLLEQNKITEEEMAIHPDKGRILKALGSSSFKGVDYTAHEYMAGDTFLLCSDGYWESITPGDTILPPHPPSVTMDLYTDQLVTEAVKVNGADESDNTTLAIVTTSSAASHPPIPQNTDQRSAPPEPKGQNMKMILMAMLYIFILFDIIVFIYLFVLK